MNIKVLSAFLILLFFIGCKEPPQPVQSTSVLRKLSDSLTLNREQNIIIYSINPNDCINCLYGFKMIEQRFISRPNSKLYLLPTEREIEKQELIRSTKTILLKDSLYKRIIWDKALFSKLKMLNKETTSASTLMIYNYKNDSIIYSKPVKFIADARELDVFL